VIGASVGRRARFGHRADKAWSGRTPNPTRRPNVSTPRAELVKGLGGLKPTGPAVSAGSGRTVSGEGGDRWASGDDRHAPEQVRQEGS